jgi:hypothetical protein
MNADGGERSAIGRALAGALGWRVAEARDQHALHATAAAVLGRREHLVVTTPPLTTDEQAIVRGDLHDVRFVDLTSQSGDPDTSVRAIRDEFGL